jgi:hypothetical protein
MMPEKPPMTGGIGEQSTSGVTAKEVAVVMTVGNTISISEATLRQIHVNKVPTWANSASRPVGDEEIHSS